MLKYEYKVLPSRRYHGGFNVSYIQAKGIINEALPGVLGNRGTRAFISGEQGNKGQILRGTGEQRLYWGTGNIRKQIFDF